MTTRPTNYYKVNLFTGKYRTRKLLSKDVADHIGLEDAKIRIIRGVDTNEGWVYHPQGWPWLIIEHGEFWPVMVRLDTEDVDYMMECLGEERGR